MASLFSDSSGNWTIQFNLPRKKRQAIRLGKMADKAAEKVHHHVEALIVAKAKGVSLAADTDVWVRDLSPFLATKLVRAGLLGPRLAIGTLDAFIQQYIASRTDVKPATVLGMEQARDRLTAYFPAEMPLRDITQADADKWLIHLRGKYAEATASRTLKRARQFFHAAKRARIIGENPFEGIKPGSMKNVGRLFNVTSEAAAKLLAVCPDDDWRAIFALCRWGGLRCPSEVLSLTWDDIKWDLGRFLVRASKTEHHEHRGLRWVPIFPELKPHLDALWDRAESGQPFVITRYRDAAQNLRTTFTKIVIRAGLKPWPRLMQNLRASRETELAERFPLHVVTQWMGNTEAIAARHYLQVTDDHFAEAMNPTPQRVAKSAAAEAGTTGTGGHRSGGNCARMAYVRTGEHDKEKLMATVGPELIAVSPEIVEVADKSVAKRVAMPDLAAAIAGLTPHQAAALLAELQRKAGQVDG